MIKNLLILFTLCVVPSAMAWAATDAFDFDNFAIVDSGDVDITMEDVDLNSGADVASVGAFDIAGIMLGMPFEDVQTLFFNTQRLET